MASVKQAWIRKYGEEEGLKRWEERKKLSAITKDNLIRKYGEEEGLNRWYSYKDKLKKRGTKQWYVDKYGEEEGVIKYEEKNSRLSVGIETLKNNGYNEEEIETIRNTHVKKSVRSLDNFIKEYGEEEGTKRYNLYRDKNRLNSSWGLKYWINKCGGNIGEAKLKLMEHQSRNIGWWTTKYGEIDGVEKYNEWVSKTTKAIMSGDSISKGQKDLEDNIKSIYNGKILGHEEQYGIILTNSEKNKYNIKNSILYPDIILPELKIIIRYHGDFWHASPKKYLNENEVLPRINKTVKEVRLIDSEKDRLYKNRGYKVIVVWESDYNLHKGKIINNIKNIIENENN